MHCNEFGTGCSFLLVVSFYDESTLGLILLQLLFLDIVTLAMLQDDAFELISICGEVVFKILVRKCTNIVLEKSSYRCGNQSCGFLVKF